MASVLASAPSMPWAGPGPAEGLSKYLLRGEPRSASHSLSMPRLALVHTVANTSLCVSFSISSLPAPWGLGQARPQPLLSWSPDQRTCLTGVLLTFF